MNLTTATASSAQSPAHGSSFADVSQENRWRQMQAEQEEAFRRHMEAFRAKQAEMQQSQETMEKLAKQKLAEQQETQLLVLQKRQQEEMRRQMTAFMVMMQEMRQQQMLSALEQQEFMLRCQANPLASVSLRKTKLAGSISLSLSFFFSTNSCQA
jgi:hypothetical protein